MALRNMHSYVEFVSAKSIHPSFFSTRCRKKSGQSTNSLSFSNTTTYMYQKDLFLWPILFLCMLCVCLCTQKFRAFEEIPAALWIIRISNSHLQGV